MSPSELLHCYHRNHDQAAFTQFVQQQFDLVYSAALRQAARDPHLARDIAQSVFTAAAQHAGALSRHPAITGWLYTTTRNQAAKHIQTQRRWQAREQKAYAMGTHSTITPANELWPQLEPLLDEALHALNTGDREAILLRYFEGQSYADLGRHLGLAENSARMRVDRALDKLRRHLARRGLTSTAAALGTLLASHTIQAAPAGLALQTTAAIYQSLVPATLTSSLLFTLKAMNSLKLATLTLGCATLVTCGVIVASTPAPSPAANTTNTGAQFSPVTSPQPPTKALELKNTEEEKPIDAVQAGKRTDADVLREIGDRLRPTGYFSSGSSRGGRYTGQSTLMLGQKGVKPGVPMTVVLDGIEYTIVITTMDRTHFTICLNNEKIIRPIRSSSGASNLPITRVYSEYGRKIRLNAMFSEHYTLTPAERESIEVAIKATKDALDSFEVQNATATFPSPDQAIITATPFSQGADIYDQMLAKVALTLGPGRNQEFLNNTDISAEYNLRECGGATHTLVIGKSFNREGVFSGYEVQESWSTADGSSTSHRSYLDRDGFALDHPHLTKLLPADFR